MTEEPLPPSTSNPPGRSYQPSALVPGTPAYSSEPPKLEAGVAKREPTWRAAYSDRTSALMASLAQLAYAPFINQRSVTRTAPREERPNGRSNLNGLLGPDFDLVQVFNRGDTQAYLATSADFAVLAFRGTHDLGDWHTNLNARQAPLPQAPTVLVHKGFLAAFELCGDEIVRAIKTHVPDSLGLYITGHSLGGALAQIASAVLERDNLAACYTFGSPRVGRAGFDVQVKCPHYRCVNRWDLVPGVPPPFFMGYRHSGDPRQILGGPIPIVERRTRPGLRAFFVDVAALTRWLVSRRLLVIDDHMIWNYRQALDTWAKLRNAPEASPEAAGFQDLARPPSNDLRARSAAAAIGFVAGALFAWTLRMGIGATPPEERR